MTKTRRVKSDPLAYAKWLWPDVKFSVSQREMILSAENNDETFVVAGNKLGKDFVAAFIVLRFFLIHKECRVVTTSVKDDHLDILWGEIKRYIETARIPMTTDKGGPLIVKHREIKKVVDGKICPISYIKGQVASKGEAMAGGHARHTMFVGDEASGLPDEYYDHSCTWAQKKLLFGNPNPCANIFRKAVKGGDVFVDGKCFRKIIRIRADESPNVKQGLLEKAAGLEPSHRELLPGMLSYREYVLRRATWNPMRQKIGLDAEFWEGANIAWYPLEWMAKGQEIAAVLQGQRRGPYALGVDPAEGSDDTAWAVVDRMGLVHLEAKKTPDTNEVVYRTIRLMEEYGIEAPNVIIDRGGGKTHADRLRAMGFPVRTVGFGESVSIEPRLGPTSLREKKELREDRYVYVDRRSEMYGEFRNLLNPQGLNRFTVNGVEFTGFGLPVGGEWDELRRQMEPIPLTPDHVGRLKLLPKHKPDGTTDEETLVGLLGRSPDHLDAVVLGCWGLLNPPRTFRMGVA